MPTLKQAIFIFSVFIAVGCDIRTSDERGYRSSDNQHMVNLTKLLDKRGVKYTFDGGEIRYDKSVEIEFNEAQKMVISGPSIKFERQEVREYFWALLDKEGVEFIPLDRDGGTWTKFWPDSEEQQMNLQLKTVEYEFSLKNTCVEEDTQNNSKLTPPNKSLNTDTSCAGAG